MMKAVQSVLLLLMLAGFVMEPNQSFAQEIVSGDTMIVNPLPPGNINNVIMGDTTATGQRADSNRVYVLAPNGPLDTVYYYNATIYSNYNITIVGKINPITGHPPVVEPAILSDYSSPGTFIQATAGNVSLKGIYFYGGRADSAIGQGTGTIVAQLADSTSVNVDNCVFDYVVQGTNSNIFYFKGNGTKIFIKNCEFRNLISTSPDQPSEIWALRGVTIDTAELVNNTYFCTQRAVMGSPKEVNYFLFNHNTVFLTAERPLAIPQMTDAVIKNNLFYGAYANGLDSINMARVTWYTTPPAVIDLDTLFTLAGSPYNFTESQRHITVENNAYYWPQAIFNNIKNLNATVMDTDRIAPPRWMSSLSAPMFTDKQEWPNNVAANNDSVDPGFASSLVQPAVDSLVKFVKLYWTNGSTGGYIWTQLPFASNPTQVFSSVPNDWASKQGYAVPENLSYTNDSLQSAGTDGYALGDLDWFPAQLKLWEAGKVNGVKQVGSQLPTRFSLSQNYPNPFNPTTDISVDLNTPGRMSLKIYNVLGQLVDVVAEGYKHAGVYKYNVNLDRFASGVYFYTLREGANAITKKMMLLK